jgi:hypothetical protein
MLRNMTSKNSINNVLRAKHLNNQYLEKSHRPLRSKQTFSVQCSSNYLELKQTLHKGTISTWPHSCRHHMQSRCSQSIWSSDQMAKNLGFPRTLSCVPIIYNNCSFIIKDINRDKSKEEMHRGRVLNASISWMWDNLSPEWDMRLEMQFAFTEWGCSVLSSAVTGTLMPMLLTNLLKSVNERKERKYDV